MRQPHSYWPGEHRSRREIDLAIGVLMGVRGCSAEKALETLVDATRVSGVGLGGVSRALLSVVMGGGEPTEPTVTNQAATHWKALLGLPTGPR